jgi:ribosomal protein S18 acetylase RimI-like enzyme
MLAAAFDWRPGETVLSTAQIMSRPDTSHYVAGWPRDTDVGFVAEEGGPVGAAWWRFFTEAEPGYGFVDAATPEISIGVVATNRGRGVGTQLLRRLIAEAKSLSLPALSLSVEPDNFAADLYERLGFATVGRMGGALTMVLPLRSSRLPSAGLSLPSSRAPDRSSSLE